MLPSSAAIQRLLDVEVALAAALADAGMIPGESVEPIRAAACAERLSLDDLDAEAERAGNIVIPLVRRLTERVAASSATAAGHVHLGATSQDILDTATVLVIRDAAATLHRELGMGVDA